MKNILKIEEFAMFLVSAYGLYLLQVEWWCYILLLLGPDISMLGYMLGNRVGMVSYNLFHHKGIGIGLLLAGWMIDDTTLQIAGIIIFGHASLDRVFGYGLKLKEGFHSTHLGLIGNKNL